MTTENTGCRRLHTVISTCSRTSWFEAPALNSDTVRITKKYVTEKIRDSLEDEDRRRYVL